MYHSPLRGNSSLERDARASTDESLLQQPFFDRLPSPLNSKTLADGTKDALNLLASYPSLQRRLSGFLTPGHVAQ